MNKIGKIISHLLHPVRAMRILKMKRLQSAWGRKLSDKKYLSAVYKLKTGKKLNLKNPQTFNEKIQWLKIYDHKPEYTTMVDKYAAKQYVSAKIGEEHIIPTLGVWDHFDDIDFESLPNQFVLKCAHDSGAVCICRDKKTFDIEKARQKINWSQEREYYYMWREWPYKDVPHRIIAEQYMKDKSQPELTDYKFYCFNGEPKFLYVSTGLENHATAAISFLTLDWQFAPYERCDYKPFAKLPPKPQNFDRMVEFARKLSAGMDFLRVDLYEINGEVYFSELTFSPGAGFTQFKDESHDLEIGKMLVLTPKG